ncbi:hypothetical protein M0R36_11065 [bacterium]|nr:hypothetical protein [bacterium]
MRKLLTKPDEMKGKIIEDVVVDKDYGNTTSILLSNNEAILLMPNSYADYNDREVIEIKLVSGGHVKEFYLRTEPFYHKWDIDRIKNLKIITEVEANEIDLMATMIKEKRDEISNKNFLKRKMKHYLEIKEKIEKNEILPEDFNNLEENEREI